MASGQSGWSIDHLAFPYGVELKDKPQSLIVEESYKKSWQLNHYSRQRSGGRDLIAWEFVAAGRISRQTLKPTTWYESPWRSMMRSFSAQFSHVFKLALTWAYLSLNSWDLMICKWKGDLLYQLLLKTQINFARCEKGAGSKKGQATNQTATTSLITPICCRSLQYLVRLWIGFHEV